MPMPERTALITVENVSNCATDAGYGCSSRAPSSQRCQVSSRGTLCSSSASVKPGLVQSAACQLDTGKCWGLDTAISSSLKSVDCRTPCHCEQRRIAPRVVIVASGGFQADIDWLADAWGPPARNFLIRGTPYNRGTVLRNLLDQGVSSVGDPTQCHAVAIDGRAPKYDGGIVTGLDCVPFSIVVNKDGQRFYDEGEDVWLKRYAIWGRLVAA